MKGIEMIVLLGSNDVRFGHGSGDGYSYDIVMHDANVAAGERMYISANTLYAPARAADHVLNERLFFNGSAETDGYFVVYGGLGGDTIIGGRGADEIWGGGGSDVIRGHLGADILRGGEGFEFFEYRDVAESTPTSRDTILDFQQGETIDLSWVDANILVFGNHAFTFIGANAFSGVAGELRAYQDSTSGVWIAEGDVDGDSIADIQIGVVLAPTDTLTASDFIL
jgi:Ca2+-binding RTX toxin-like protein